MEKIVKLCLVSLGPLIGLCRASATACSQTTLAVSAIPSDHYRSALSNAKANVRLARRYEKSFSFFIVMTLYIIAVLQF